MARDPQTNQPINTTNYFHPEDPALNDFHQTMDYDPFGQPILRVAQTRASYTSKNRQRVSNFTTWAFYTSQFGKGTDLWDESLTSGATITHDPYQSALTLAVTSTVGSKAVRQTKHVMPYIPARPAEFSVAHRWETPRTGIRRRAGVFDQNNGMFFEDGGDLNYYCVIRSDVSHTTVDTRVARANWNGDKLDGTGPSGITANADTVQLMVIEYEWYGAGAVHFNFVIDGVKHRIHSFYHSNVAHDVYISTPFLPIRFEIENIGSAVGETFILASCSFGLEGDSMRMGIPICQQIPLPGLTLSVANTFYHAFSLRLKPGSLSGIAMLEQLQFFTTDNTTLAYRIILNATLTGGTWADHELPNSLVQVNTGATYTGGTIIYRGLVPNTGTPIDIDSNGSFQIGRTSLGTVSDTITIALTAFNANKTAVGTATWREIR